MVVDPSIERAEPGSGNARDNRHADPILQTDANAALERWLQDHPEIERELKDTVRAHIHFQELEARTREAERALEAAEQRYATLLRTHDVAGRRIFGWTVGLALVVALVVLARTRSFTLSHSLGIVRRARRDAATARIAQGLASQKLQRHIGAPWQMLLPWALGTAAPARVDRAKWAVALRQSVRQLFPVS